MFAMEAACAPAGLFAVLPNMAGLSSGYTTEDSAYEDSPQYKKDMEEAKKYDAQHPGIVMKEIRQISEWLGHSHLKSLSLR